MYRLFIVIIAGFALLSVPLPSFSEDYGLEDVWDEETSKYEYSYGEVASIDKNTGRLVLSEFDSYNDLEVEVTYYIDSDVKVGGTGSWKDIAIGSVIDVEYYIDDTGKKMVKFIEAYE